MNESIYKNVFEVISCPLSLYYSLVDGQKKVQWDMPIYLSLDMSYQRYTDREHPTITIQKAWAWQKLPTNTKKEYI